ncbi:MULTISPECIES: cytochrome P450 [Actinomadura]|uniref:Cytochrome P450 n=1 Tax=Actinomadura yumaensis TaxID=111807 RepID=A0ABW2CV99_9ACTN|nr:cytochrome P450 [Actinomadura sp. J1-007]MWK39143.1 cytochrome P450 [Actinomadura sp. J1-007]
MELRREGAVHERRRAIVNETLADIAPSALREDVRARLAPNNTVSDETRVRDVLVAVLGRALGVRGPDALDALVEAVPVAAARYLTGDPDPAADAAVRTLVQVLGGGLMDEEVANRIAVLMQACEATVALVRNATVLARDLPDPGRWPAEAVVAETLRYDPPVPAMRRTVREDVEAGGHAVAAGSLVTLDLRAANRDPAVFSDPDRFDPGRAEPWHLTFGAGRRPCPGADHALHLAAGVLDAALATKETAR